jgi:Protein of unknown function (DUF3570)
MPASGARMQPSSRPRSRTCSERIHPGVRKPPSDNGARVGALELEPSPMSLRQSVVDATGTRALAALVAALALGSCGREKSWAGVRSADSAFYARSDTDNTVVYAPRVHVGAKLGDSVGLDATYAMDSWTGASIDVVTAATDAIHELRHEVNAGGSYLVKNVTLSGSYRYSTENDYWSHGGVGNLALDLFDKNTTLALSVFGAKDIVGKAGDSAFRRPQDSIGGRLTLTQILDTKMLLTAAVETLRITGYQASPYRRVGVENLGLCAHYTDHCLPESHPHERLRTAISGRLRRAFGSKVSMGVDFRYYLDNWGLRSDTAGTDLTVLVSERGSLTLAYRFYIQGQADFYQALYPQPVEQLTYFTRDRKLSPFKSHRLGLEYLQGFALGEQASSVLELGARAGVSRILYDDFIGLSSVDVLELTGMLGLSFL